MTERNAFRWFRVFRNRLMLMRAGVNLQQKQNLFEYSVRAQKYHKTLFNNKLEKNLVCQKKLNIFAHVLLSCVSPRRYISYFQTVCI